MKESEISRRGFLRESSASGLLLLGGTAFLKLPWRFREPKRLKRSLRRVPE